MTFTCNRCHPKFSVTEELKIYNVLLGETRSFSNQYRWHGYTVMYKNALLQYSQRTDRIMGVHRSNSNKTSLKNIQLTHEPFASQSTQYLLSSSRSISIKRFWHFSCICLERSFSRRDVIFVQWRVFLHTGSKQCFLLAMQCWTHMRAVKWYAVMVSERPQ